MWPFNLFAKILNTKPETKGKGVSDMVFKKKDAEKDKKIKVMPKAKKPMPKKKK